MNTARILVGLVGTHALVGMVAWINGWLTGRHIERRNHERDWQQPIPHRAASRRDGAGW